MGASFLIGVAATMVCAMVLRGWARRRRVVRKVGTPLAEQARDLPPVGGLALAIGCVAGALVWQAQLGIEWTAELRGLVGAGMVILVIGLIDDFVRELRPWQKLLGQCLAWVLLVRGGIVTQIVMLPPWANLLVSLIWTLAIINALNLLDIADGLAVGVGFIAAGTFAIISVLAGQVALAGLLAATCGALLGGFGFNFPRATLFLGDSGSMLLGLLLAAFALAISYAPLGREMALLTPIVVLGLPIYDLAFVMIVRRRNGRSMVKKSRDHFVFRLVREGFSPTKAVLAMFGLCLTFAVTALVISQVPNSRGAIAIGVVVSAAIVWAVRIARVPTT